MQAVLERGPKLFTAGVARTCWLIQYCSLERKDEWQQPVPRVSEVI